MAVIDRRTREIWVDRAAMEIIRGAFSGRRLPVARSIYIALCEIAADVGASAVEVARREVATRAGVTPKALDDYAPELEEAGVVAVERRHDGTSNLPNRWIVLPVSVVVTPALDVAGALPCVYCGGVADTTDHVVAKSRGGGDGRVNVVPACRSCNASKRDHDLREWAAMRGIPLDELDQRMRGWGSGVPTSNRGAPSHPAGGVPTSTTPPERRERREERTGNRGWPPPGTLDGIEVSADMLADAEELLRQKKRVDSRVVTPEEIARAAAALDEFNRQSGRAFGLGAHLTMLVGRVRERPAATAERHQRLVQSAWRLRWWEQQWAQRTNGARRRRTGPEVIYGNSRVFEQVVQDAADEAKGAPPDMAAAAETAVRRYTREDD